MRLYGDTSNPVFAIAPMMDWTDRHCRYFHRQISRRALLYTEMVVADAVIHGDRQRLLGYDDCEHLVALQLGGSDPGKLAEAARIGEGFGYDEINLNVGCPSDRVQSGVFGACLMQTPDLVARCVEAMKQSVTIPVTVKCRLGVDEQDPETALDEIAARVNQAGCDALWVHARKAWLQGLSPKENREIPPLDYNRVYRLKAVYSQWFVGINGGIDSMEACRAHVEKTDGVMIGRAAYQTPDILFGIDAFDSPSGQDGANYERLIETMAEYCERHVAEGGKLSHVTRHMIGLFHGLPGARRWRQILSTEAVKPGAGIKVLHAAFREVDHHAAA